MTAEEIVQKIGNILEEEQRSIPKEISSEEKLSKYILPALEKNKSTLANLYQYAPKTANGFLGRIKAKILLKLRNITINIVERESMRQQKFNELVYQALLEMNRMREERGENRKG